MNTDRQTPRGWDAILKGVQDFNATQHSPDVYLINPPAPLIDRAAQYYRDYAPKLERALKEDGNTEATTAAILADFGAALLGCFDFMASPEDMAAAGFYLSSQPFKYFAAKDAEIWDAVLLCAYSDICESLGDYQKQIKEIEDAAKRAAFFDGLDDGAPGLGFFWLTTNGYLEVKDFRGLQQNEIIHALNTITKKGQIAWYWFYCLIAGGLLGADVQTIPAPRCITNDEYRAEILSYIREKIGNSERNGRKRGPDPLKIPKDYALALSRDITAANNKDARDVLPISKFIGDYVKDGGAEITPYVAEKVLQGVLILYQTKNPPLIGKSYEINTNISELATCCGITDANDAEKKDLRAALAVLHNLYIAVWRPTGRVAVQFLSVHEFGAEAKNADNLQLLLYPDALKGRPVIISQREMLTFKDRMKGQARSHLIFQILSKHHKEENALLTEVFGYDTTIKEAELTGDAEQIKAARDSIRKHRARDLKRLISWLDGYQKAGLIEYEIKEQSGRRVFQWRRFRDPTEKEQRGE